MALPTDEINKVLKEQQDLARRIADEVRPRLETSYVNALKAGQIELSFSVEKPALSPAVARFVRRYLEEGIGIEPTISVTSNESPWRVHAKW